ncbi:MAG: 4-(cytidine 5'-diphospho)-2-C-methyl-D-erythritol kinase [Chloroflexi bacterium]|nr:4-(cytidine 5'-diphospho)-2-C-methyl-D-erythritol kinase [Chloroflexota bacterium]
MPAREIGITVVVKCFAKINLTLEILGKRADGFHEVRSVMQTVGLADRLEVAAADELSFTCSDPVLAKPENLVYRAARLLQTEFSVRAGAALRLEKRIPVAAGLGGGSSDAAGAIIALNRLWNLQLSLTEMQALAAGLGSDVPFFLTGGTALATGRGERITPLPPLPPHWVVLVPLPITLSTASVYDSVNPFDYTAGVATADIVAAAQHGALSSQTRWHNALERPARALAPALAAAQAALLDAGAPHAHVSGSGPTVFTVCRDEAAARRLADRLRAQGCTAAIVPFVQSGWTWGGAVA